MTRMGRVLAILFFGSVWGAAEALLGGLLYGAEVPYAAAPLAVIALAVLTLGRAWCPHAGSATLMAACAMLFKFANAPFWGCHLLGIFLLGGAYDLVLLSAGRMVPGGGRRTVRDAVVGAAAAYLGFALFAVLLTYVVRYEYWVRGGLPRVLDHVLVGGTLAAAGCAVAVPLAARLGDRLRAVSLGAASGRASLAAGGLWLVTAALWVLAVTAVF